MGIEDENTEVVDSTSAAAEAGAAEAAAEAAETETTETVPAEGATGGTETPPPGEGETESEGEEPPAEGDEESEEFKPNTKFKAGIYNKSTRSLEQKEFEIDPKFHAIMTDPDSEKLVRELHEKAHGLESVKERFAETRQAMTEVTDENRQIKGSIDGLRKVYQGALKTGNLHKLDGFFQTLQIPQDVIMQYALEKVKLAEMEPGQRNAILGQLESERRADELSQREAQLQTENMNAVQQARSAMVDLTLARPEVNPLQKEFDERMGKPGAFREAVFAEGNFAWHSEKVDLPPEQAVQRVIQRYALTTPNGHALPRTTPAPAATTQQSAQSVSANGKPVVQRTTRTIPNVQGRSTSALPQKPRSVEDLKKVYADKYGNQ